MRTIDKTDLLILKTGYDKKQISIQLGVVFKLLVMARFGVGNENLVVNYFAREKTIDGQVKVTTEKNCEISAQEMSYSHITEKIVSESLVTPQQFVSPLRLCEVRFFDSENPDVAIRIEEGKLVVQYWQFNDSDDFEKTQFETRALILKNAFGKYNEASPR